MFLVSLVVLSTLVDLYFSGGGGGGHSNTITFSNT
jgi:hypothetical protein